MATVKEIIEALEDLDPDTEIMVQYQPEYPLRETVAPGIWDPHGNDRVNMTRSFVCAGCDETVSSELTLVQQTFDEDGNAYCDKCVEELFDSSKHNTSDGRPIVYLVLTGAPHDINPYGDRQAFEDGDY